MATISIKRVYESPSHRDGKRILVDRLWPRGLRKVDAAIDVWMKDIAPQPSLRTWFDHRADRFNEFKHQYLDELRSNPAVPTLLAIIGNHTATLLFAAHDTKINHAVILATFLTKAQLTTSPGRHVS
ncbi:DUF488 domain-containing protein [Tardiphaga robiniae]|uniref:DUF488 family protein n=1 Tax=Tardiphaga robiniae TaxID=943830 RepID=A0A7G6TTZ7_9BRAD|nr:DUF488 family protein [Tardiphaga robiniae]QND70229.1 DUF488 family protein [Tardiphaga robiniae]